MLPHLALHQIFRLWSFQSQDFFSHTEKSSLKVSNEEFDLQSTNAETWSDHPHGGHVFFFLPLSSRDSFHGLCIAYFCFSEALVFFFINVVVYFRFNFWPERPSMPLQSPQFSILKVKFSQPSKFLSDHLLKGQIAHNWGHILLCSKSNKRLFSCTTLTISVVKSTNLNSKLELLKPTTGNFPPTKGILFWPKQGIIFSPTEGNISSTHKREFFFVLIVFSLFIMGTFFNYRT